MRPLPSKLMSQCMQMSQKMTKIPAIDLIDYQIDCSSCLHVSSSLFRCTLTSLQDQVQKLYHWSDCFCLIWVVLSIFGCSTLSPCIHVSVALNFMYICHSCNHFLLFPVFLYCFSCFWPLVYCFIFPFGFGSHFRLLWPLPIINTTCT